MKLNPSAYDVLTDDVEACFQISPEGKFIMEIKGVTGCGSRI